MEFFSNSPEEKGRQLRAKGLAMAAGWRAVGSTYVHSDGRRYRMRDMDGWADLCENEAIFNE